MPILLPLPLRDDSASVRLASSLHSYLKNVVSAETKPNESGLLLFQTLMKSIDFFPTHS